MALLEILWKFFAFFSLCEEKRGWSLCGFRKPHCTISSKNHISKGFLVFSDTSLYFSDSFYVYVNNEIVLGLRREPEARFYQYLPQMGESCNICRSLKIFRNIHFHIFLFLLVAFNLSAFAKHGGHTKCPMSETSTKFSFCSSRNQFIPARTWVRWELLRMQACPKNNSVNLITYSGKRTQTSNSNGEEIADYDGKQTAKRPSLSLHHYENSYTLRKMTLE